MKRQQTIDATLTEKIVVSTREEPSNKMKIQSPHPNSIKLYNFVN
jgi:hypothetical protein